MPGAIKWGGEFILNTTTTSFQSGPAVTALADGRFVAAWTDSSQSGGDTSSAAIRAQLFNADGTKSGDELLVNTTTAGAQVNAAVTALSGGGFVVAWTDKSMSTDDPSGDAVRAQIFDAAGAPSGDEFLVNTRTPNGQFEPAVTALSGGGFVVTWTDGSSGAGDTSDLAVRARIFDAIGEPSAVEFLVNTTTTSRQDTPAVTTLSDGRFVVTWTDLSGSGGDTSGSAVRAQIFDAAGVKSGAELLVNTTTQAGQQDPAVMGLAGGGFVVTWTDASQTGGDTSLQAIRGQVFDATGAPSGGEFLVNTTTTDIQSHSVVTALPDGGFVVAWADNNRLGEDTSGGAVRAQVFKADGTKSGGEFLVNTTTDEAQGEAAVTALADGRFMVSWSDFSQSGGDTSGYAVRAQIFDPREGGVNLAGTARNDDYVGSGFNDTMAGGEGDDRFDGGAGNDLVIGGLGDDTIAGGRASIQPPTPALQTRLSPAWSPTPPRAGTASTR